MRHGLVVLKITIFAAHEKTNTFFSYLNSYSNTSAFRNSLSRASCVQSALLLSRARLPRLDLLYQALRLELSQQFSRFPSSLLSNYILAQTTLYSYLLVPRLLPTIFSISHSCFSCAGSMRGSKTPRRRNNLLARYNFSVRIPLMNSYRFDAICISRSRSRILFPSRTQCLLRRRIDEDLLRYVCILSIP